MYIIQIGYQYHISPIEEATIEYNLYSMILRGNQKSAKTKPNAADLEKSLGKEVEHVWALSLINDLVRHIHNGGVILIGVS